MCSIQKAKAPEPQFEGFLKWGGVQSVKPEFFPQPQVCKIISLSKPKLYRDPSFLQQKYVVERLSIGEISRLIFSSEGAVRNGLRRAEIEIRNQEQQGKTKGQLGFGEAWRRHRLAAHKREEQAIQQMLKLRAEGLSFRGIATALNTWKVPTKTRKGKWSGKQVHQILARLRKAPRAFLG